MTSTPITLRNWSLFSLLCFIWGSSFILMKAGLTVLSPYQVAALRMVSAALVLSPVAFQQITKLDAKTLTLITLSGLLGSFFPAYLFCLAETKLDSSLAGFMNAFTPLLTIIIGILFFAKKIAPSKILGIVVGFAGMLLLLLAKKNPDITYLSYAGFVLAAVICYSININLVSRFLQHVSPVRIAAIGFCLLMPFSFAVLLYTDYFKLPLFEREFLYATMASIVLGCFGTAIATIMFYVLIKNAGVVFSSMVTYGVPFIALGWGLLAGDQINLLQIVGLIVILAGVYLTNIKKSRDEPRS